MMMTMMMMMRRGGGGECEKEEQEEEEYYDDDDDDDDDDNDDTSHTNAASPLFCPVLSKEQLACSALHVDKAGLIPSFKRVPMLQHEVM